MLELVKTYLGITDNSKDGLLQLLISIADDYFLNYTHYQNNGGECDLIILKMVVEDYNKWGSEGIESTTFGSANEKVYGEYSPGLMREINQYKRVRVL